MRPFEIFLAGGLGNQLFQWSAGQYLSERTGRRVVYRLDNVWSKKFENHGVALTGRGVRGLFCSADNAHLTCSLSQRTFCRLLLSGRNRPPWFRSRELGFDSSLDELNHAARVSGFFQSWRYTVTSDRPRLEATQLLRRGEPSIWFQEHFHEIETSNPTILHLRRGDYRNFQDKFGLLSFEYYGSALADLLPKDARERVWVFSDDYDEAKALSRFIGGGARAILPPNDSDPGESMALMSKGRYHVIGNSTFGWWSAFLSQSSLGVVRPDRWFRRGESPRDLFPKHWLRAKASFQGE